MSQAIDFNHRLSQTTLPYLLLVITAIMCYYWLCYYFHRKNLKPYNYSWVFTNTGMTPDPSLAKNCGNFCLPFRSFVQKQSLHQVYVPQQKKREKKTTTILSIFPVHHIAVYEVQVLQGKRFCSASSLRVPGEFLL